MGYTATIGVPVVPHFWVNTRYRYISEGTCSDTRGTTQKQMESTQSDDQHIEHQSPLLFI